MDARGEREERVATAKADKPPQKRDAEKTRQAILRAGLREFAQQGFSGGRAERIATAARRNIRMLYHYFGSKEGLYTSVLEDAYTKIRAKEATLALSTDEPLESLLELMRFTFEYFAGNPLFEGLLRTENMMRGRFVRKSRQVAETAFPLLRTIADLIVEGQRRGELREGLDAQNVYVTITALSRFHLANAFTMSALLDTDLTKADWRQRRLEHCLEVAARLSGAARRGLEEQAFREQAVHALLAVHRLGDAENPQPASRTGRPARA